MTKTTYSPEMLEKIYQYRDDWREFNPSAVVPSAASLAKYLGIGRQTLYDWKERHDEVRDAMDVILGDQEDILIQCGLSKQFDPKLTAMMLSSHGWVQKKELDHRSGDKSMSPKQSIDASKLSTEALAEILNAANNTSD